MIKLLLTIMAFVTPVLGFQTEICPEEAVEMSGQEQPEPSRYDQKAAPSRATVLLIPDSTADVVGMYDPYDGEYLGDFIVNDPSGTQYNFQTPINAVQGPNDYIFVSDQISDAVYTFDTEGEFLFVAAQTGMNNLRGLDFRGDTLFVTSGDDYVAMFSGPDQFAGYFIQDGTDPFDILFTDEYTTGAALLADIQGSTDNVRLYEPDGSFVMELFKVNFPEQIQIDAGNPGHYLVIAFSENVIHQFTIDGTITDTWNFSGGRGVYRLGNGNLLATNGSGVQEIDPATGSIIDTKNTGSCRFIELANVTVTGTWENQTEAIPGVGINIHPNPFSEVLTIQVTLDAPSAVEAAIYSLNGRLVAEISPGMLGQGTHLISWNGRTDDGRPVGQGAYFVRVSTAAGFHTEKVHLVR
jgi:hypothetical protein